MLGIGSQIAFNLPPFRQRTQGRDSRRSYGGNKMFQMLLVSAHMMLFGIICAYSQTTSTTSSNSNAAVTVVTNDATSVTSTSGALDGTISLNGRVAAAWFEWGTTTALGTRSSSQIFQDGMGARAFTAKLTDLKPSADILFPSRGLSTCSRHTERAGRY